MLQAQIVAMTGALNLWTNTSLVVAKAQEQGVTHACNLHKWILDFVWDGQLPLHQYGQSRWMILEDEDILQSLQLWLEECAKYGYINVANVVEIIKSPNMQAKLRQVRVCKPTITEQMAHNWLKKLNWWYEEKRNGMYIDGHEREDMVPYWRAFVACWKEYEKHFHMWDHNGNILLLPSGFPVPRAHFHLILVAHNKSTFYQNDERKTHWANLSSTAKQKGNRQSLMVSDFLTVIGHVPCWPCNWCFLHVSQYFSAWHLCMWFPTSSTGLPNAYRRPCQRSQCAHTCATNSDTFVHLSLIVPWGGLAHMHALWHFAATFNRTHSRQGFTFIACAHPHGRWQHSYFHPYQLTTGSRPLHAIKHRNSGTPWAHMRLHRKVLEVAWQWEQSHMQPTVSCMARIGCYK